METTIVKQENPAELMRQSTDVAGVCSSIVKKTAVPIQGKKYVQVEGWQSIATAHGCIAGAEQPQTVDGGVEAMGYVKRMSDGLVLSTGYGFVGDDEKAWAARPMYARRAMAQTRAISRACRSAFSHVVVLIDGNLSTTPAEEVPREGFERSRPVNGTPKPAKPAPKPAKPAPAPAKVVDVEPETESAEPLEDNPAWASVELGFGKYKGRTVGELLDMDEGYLHWLDQKWEPKLRDDGDMWQSDKELKAAVTVALGGGLAPAESGTDEADDDVPF